MDSERLELSTMLLLAVLGGMTYEAVAREHGMTRTGVERRVKALVLRLVREIGVEGLNESRAVFVRTLRAHRLAIESALQRYGPMAPAGKTDAPVILSDEDIQAAMRRARLHTATPERDVAMVWILLATGARPLEVARMQVRDYLNDDGTVRLQSEVRAEEAVNRRSRPLYFTSVPAREAIDAYLAVRAPGSAGAQPLAYRGLDPVQALFLTQEGAAFPIERIPTASGMRYLCEEIHYAYRKIFRRIGIPGLSAQNVRHTVMHRLVRRGADEEQIGELLGIRDVRPPRCPRPSLEQLMEGLV